MNKTTILSPKLTLVVLVRDEAPDLRRLLTWHRDLYDQAVVVDTGSEDDSVALAVEQGAQVTHFSWCDDFSAARNHGLAAVEEGGWVLILDCDELIAKEDFTKVRRMCTTEPTGWFFEQWNYCGRINDPQWFPVPLNSSLAPASAVGYVNATTCRLFPAGDDLNYQGVVHELPDKSLAAAGVPLSKSTVVIHHYGHLVDSVKQRSKKSRYARMLRKKLKQNPQDVKARYEMAVQLITEARPDLAQRLLARTISENPHHPDTHRARLLLGRLHIQQGDPGAALVYMEQAVQKWPEWREGWIDTVRVLQQLKRREPAARYAEQGLSLFPLDPTLQALAREVSCEMAEKYQANG